MNFSVNFYGKVYELLPPWGKVGKGVLLFRDKFTSFSGRDIT